MDNNSVFCFLIISGVVIIQINIALCNVQQSGSVSKMKLGAKDKEQTKSYKAQYWGKNYKEDNSRPKTATFSQSGDKFQRGKDNVEVYSIKSSKEISSERKDKRTGAYNMKTKGKVTTEDVGMKSNGKKAKTNEEKTTERFSMKADQIVKMKPEKKTRDFSMKPKGTVRKTKEEKTIERFSMKAEGETAKMKPEKKMRDFSAKPKGKVRKTKEEKNIGRFSMKSKDNKVKTKLKKNMKDFIMQSKRKPAKGGEKEGRGYKMKPKENHLKTSENKLAKTKDVISQRKKASPNDSQGELKRAEAQLNELKRLTKQLKNENRILKQMVSPKRNTKSLADNKDEAASLRALLKESNAANKRLKKQNKRQKLIWFALQQMCKALDRKSQKNGFSEKEPSESVNNVSKINENQNTTTHGFNIQPLSVSSRSLEGGKTEIQVEFRASSQRPAVDWFITLPYGGVYRTGGRREYRAANNTYLSSLVVSLSPQGPLVYFRIHDAQDYSEIHLDQRAINVTKHETIAPVKILIEEPNAAIVAPDHENLNISLFVNGNLRQNDYFDTGFSGIYTSVGPPVMFQIGRGRNPGMNFTTSAISDTRLQVSIEIAAELAKYGGLLSLEAVMSTENMVPVSEYPGLISHIFFVRSFKVLSSSTKTVVPPNSVALSMLPNVTLLASQSQSVSCSAMGDPRPNVTLYRDTNGDWEELMPHQILNLGEFSTIKTFEIDANDTEVEGKYICSASNAITSVTSMTEVIIHVPATIDNDASGLTINSSNKIEISCKASGKPAPRVELRLYDEWGPDVSKSSKYKVLKSHPDSRTSILQVTISPVDTDMYRFYCYATNSDYYQQPTLLIDVFTEPPTGYNWELYRELQGYK